MRDAVDKIPRAYPTRDCEYGILAVGVPTRESRSPKVWEGGGPSALIPGPPLAAALATTQEGKSKQFAEDGPQSPFRQRSHLAWPPFSAPFYPALWARLVSSGSGDFPFCRPRQTANGTPEA